MLKSAILFLTVFMIPAFAGETVATADIDAATKNYIRQTFYAGVENENKAEELFNYIEKNFGKKLSKMSPFVAAYYGGSETLLAKHAGNPFTKLDRLNAGLDKIAYALKKMPNSLEIRFMRFSILHYLPFFLGHEKERDDDLAVIYDLLLKKDYSELDKKTQEGVIKFVLESDRLEKNKRPKLQALLK